MFIISLASSLAASIIPRIDSQLLKKALPQLERMLRLREIRLETVESIFRRAARLGALRYLDPEERSLLNALRAFLRIHHVVRSETIIAIVRRIYAKIEAHSLRGKAILIGILLRMRLGKMIEDLETLLIEGLQFINRPPPYRVL